MPLIICLALGCSSKSTKDETIFGAGSGLEQPARAAIIEVLRNKATSWQALTSEQYGASNVIEMKFAGLDGKVSILQTASGMFRIEAKYRCDKSSISVVSEIRRLVDKTRAAE